MSRVQLDHTKMPPKKAPVSSSSRRPPPLKGFGAKGSASPEKPTADGSSSPPPAAAAPRGPQLDQSWFFLPALNPDVIAGSSRGTLHQRMVSLHCKCPGMPVDSILRVPPTATIAYVKERIAAQHGGAVQHIQLYRELLKGDRIDERSIVRGPVPDGVLTVRQVWGLQDADHDPVQLPHLSGANLNSTHLPHHFGTSMGTLASSHSFGSVATAQASAPHHSTARSAVSFLHGTLGSGSLASSPSAGQHHHHHHYHHINPVLGAAARFSPTISVPPGAMPTTTSTSSSLAPSPTFAMANGGAGGGGSPSSTGGNNPGSTTNNNSPSSSTGRPLRTDASMVGREGSFVSGGRAVTFAGGGGGGGGGGGLVATEPSFVAGPEREKSTAAGGVGGRASSRHASVGSADRSRSQFGGGTSSHNHASRRPPPYANPDIVGHANYFITMTSALSAKTSKSIAANRLAAPRAVSPPEQRNQEEALIHVEDDHALVYYTLGAHDFPTPLLVGGIPGHSDRPKIAALNIKAKFGELLRELQLPVAEREQLKKVEKKPASKRKYRRQMTQYRKEMLDRGVLHKEWRMGGSGRQFEPASKFFPGRGGDSGEDDVDNTDDDDDDNGSGGDGDDDDDCSSHRMKSMKDVGDAAVAAKIRELELESALEKRATKERQRSLVIASGPVFVDSEEK